MPDYEAWVPYGLAIDAASGAFFVLLGGAVAFLSRTASPEKRRLAWAFAVFSIVWGANLFFRNIAREEIGNPLPGASELSLLTAVLQILATIWLALAFPRSLVGRERGVLVAPALVGIVAGLAQLLLWEITPGWGLLIVFAAETLSFTFLLLAFAARYTSPGSQTESDRRGSRLATIAFVPYWGFAWGAVVLAGAASGWEAQVGTAVGLVATYVAALWWMVASRRAGRVDRPARQISFALFAGPVIGGLLAAATDPRFALDLGFAGLTRLFAVLVLAYAILRHQLLGLDVKVRWTLAKSTVAAIFLVVFFVASEGAQAAFSDRWGTAIGIAVAAGLLFALAPIQSFAERLATAAVPAAGAPTAAAEEREESYRFALSKALGDGELTRDEERALAHLASHLGIGAGRAFELREEVDAERGRRAR